MFTNETDDVFFLTGLGESLMSVLIALFKTFLSSHLWTRFMLCGVTVSFVLLWELTSLSAVLLHKVNLYGVLYQLVMSPAYHLLRTDVFVMTFMPDFMVNMRRNCRLSLVGRMKRRLYSMCLSLSIPVISRAETHGAVYQSPHPPAFHLDQHSSPVPASATESHGDEAGPSHTKCNRVASTAAEDALFAAPPPVDVYATASAPVTSVDMEADDALSDMSMHNFAAANGSTHVGALPLLEI